MGRVQRAKSKTATGDKASVGFATVRTQVADNLFAEVAGDLRITAGRKPRLKAMSSPRNRRDLQLPDERLPAAINALLRKNPVPGKASPAADIANLPYLTLRSNVRGENGDVALHSLKPGDKILTRDNGFQPVNWLAIRKIRAAALGADEALKLIHVKAGALAKNMPETDVWVTPSQSFLMTPASHWQGIGVSEMLVKAADLVSLQGVEETTTRKVGLVQILLDSHEVILVNGAWTGSLRPDPDCLQVMPDEHRKTLCDKFPDLQDQLPCKPFPSARVERKPQTALYLMNAGG